MSENDSIRQEASPHKPGGAKKAVRNAFIFLLCLGAFFSLGFFLIGPRIQRASAPPPPAQAPVADNTWGQAPPPPRPKPAPKPAPSGAEVEVNEISPGSEASTNAGSTTREAETLEQLSHSEETPATSEAVEAEPSSRSPHRFYVQVGVYEDKSNARILVSRLTDEGYGANIRQISRRGTTAYQVVIGAAREKSDAQKLVDELRTAGKDVTMSPAD